MGGEESKPKGEFDQKINHPRFQNIRLIKLRDNEERIEVKASVANEKEYEQWVNSLRDTPFDKENYLLPESYSFDKEGFCGSSGFVSMIFSNFPFILTDEIRNREYRGVNTGYRTEDQSHLEGQQKYFEEAELWYLVYTLIEAGHQFHVIGKKVGDVRPENVFINENGQVKISTQLTFPSEHTNYHKTFYEKENTYLAPEELKDVRFAKMEPSGDLSLAESFSIGLTCLDAATLSNSSNLYQKNQSFGYDELAMKLIDLERIGYSEILNLTIGSLCEVDSEKRSSCTELFNWLKPYEEYIINLEEFKPNSFPQKIQASISTPESTIQSSNLQAHQPNFIPQQQPNQIVIPPGQRVTYTHHQQEFHQSPLQPPVQPHQPQHQLQYQPQQPQHQPQYATYTSSQYNPGQSFTNNQPNYQPVHTSIRQDTAEKSKSMALTLERIDEQLQMSRRMFPS